MLTATSSASSPQPPDASSSSSWSLSLAGSWAVTAGIRGVVGISWVVSTSFAGSDGAMLMNAMSSLEVFWFDVDGELRHVLATQQIDHVHHVGVGRPAIGGDHRAGLGVGRVRDANAGGQGRVVDRDRVQEGLAVLVDRDGERGRRRLGGGALRQLEGDRLRRD